MWAKISGVMALDGICSGKRSSAGRASRSARWSVASSAITNPVCVCSSSWGSNDGVSCRGSRGLMGLSAISLSLVCISAKEIDTIIRRQISQSPRVRLRRMHQRPVKAFSENQAGPPFPSPLFPFLSLCHLGSRCPRRYSKLLQQAV